MSRKGKERMLQQKEGAWNALTSQDVRHFCKFEDFKYLLLPVVQDMSIFWENSDEITNFPEFCRNLNFEDMKLLIFIFSHIILIYCEFLLVFKAKSKNIITLFNELLRISTAFLRTLLNVSNIYDRKLYKYAKRKMNNASVGRILTEYCSNYNSNLIKNVNNMQKQLPFIKPVCLKVRILRELWKLIYLGHLPIIIYNYIQQYSFYIIIILYNSFLYNYI